MTIDPIRELLEFITKNLKDSFQEKFKCLIIYGSWAKGFVREYAKKVMEVYDTCIKI